MERLPEGEAALMPPVDDTHDPGRSSWVLGADGHVDFPIQNLPFGIFSTGNSAPRPGVAIGDAVLDLAAIAPLLPGPAAVAVGTSTLNSLLALSAADRLALRRRLSRLLSDAAHRARVEPALVASGATLHLPAAIGDYTDFYVGIHHATNVGRQFRPDIPLLPNYKWVPIGYHGRASSVRVSGVPVVRPNGQRLAPDADSPDYGPTRRLDHELELGIWIGGTANPLGEPVAIDDAPDRIAGLCLLNDWSARDVQAWEYQPLGPFLAKSFHTTVSPWVVTTEALAPFRIAQPPRPTSDPRPLPYLWSGADQAAGAFAIELQATLSSAAMRRAGLAPVVLSRGPASSMYWTAAQIVTHHASNGCDLHSGDLLGTGTISSAGPDGLGSMLEITKGGARTLVLPTGEHRTFLEDGDELALFGRATADGRARIGFGECRAIIEPARATAATRQPHDRSQR